MNIFNRLRTECESTFAADSTGSYDAGFFQDPQVFGHALSREVEAFCELRDRSRLAVAESSDEIEPRWVAECREYRNGIDRGATRVLVTAMR